MNDPIAYDTQNGLIQKKDAKEFIPQLVQSMNWTSKELVLDFGSGPGSVTKNILLPAIKSRMPIGSDLEILGVDISKTAVVHAAVEHAHPNIKYQHFDIIGKHFNEFEGKFDKIFSFHALHWIPETTKALERLYKMLKTGGEIGMYCIGIYALNPEIDEARQDPEFGEFVHKFADTQEYAKEFKRAGFEVLEAETITQQYFFENLDSPADMLMSMGVADVPKGKEDKFRKFAAKAFKNWFKPSPTSESPERVLSETPVVMVRARKV